MGKIIIKGMSKKVFFKANNYYGSDLKVSVLDDDIGEWIANAVPMTEIMEPVTEFNTTVVTDASVGIKVIELETVAGLNNSDRIKIGNSVYRLTAIDILTKNVTLHSGLNEAVVANAPVERVGNMGIFKIQLVVTKNGYFVIQAKDSKFGIMYSDSITVKENSIEELLEFTNIEINENERIIKETSSFSIII